MYSKGVKYTFSRCIPNVIYPPLQAKRHNTLFLLLLQRKDVSNASFVNQYRDHYYLLEKSRKKYIFPSRIFVRTAHSYVLGTTYNFPVFTNRQEMYLKKRLTFTYLISTWIMCDCDISLETFLRVVLGHKKPCFR